VGRQPPGAQSNVKHYDSQGYLDGAFVRSLGTGWMSELKGFSDFTYRGQEGARDGPNRHSPGLGNVDGSRTPHDEFVYDHIMRIAWRAGQHGFGLQRGPQ